MATGPAAINGTLGDRLGWALGNRSAVVHEWGRESGFAIGRAAGRYQELGERAYWAQDVDRKVALRAMGTGSGTVAAMLRERRRFGALRAAATAEPFPGAGPLPWGDLYQPGRELRAAGFTV